MCMFMKMMLIYNVPLHASRNKTHDGETIIVLYI
jgi:hypothetical protein